MPKYLVELTDGRKYNIESERVLTQAELDQHAQQFLQSQPQAPLDAVSAAAERSHQARLAAENGPSAAPYLIAGMVVLAVVALILLRKLIQSRPWLAIPGAVRSTVKMKDKMAFDLSDEDGEWFAAAEEEITTGNVEKATWSRALVKAGGNEEKRKAEYILLRVKKLRISKVAEAVE